MQRVRLRAAARADIVAIMEHMANDSPRSARRFLRAVELIAKRLIVFPELGSLYESEDIDFEGLRVFAIPKFWNYLVFYRFHDDAIEIVRVLHGARNIPTILEG